MNKRRIHFSGAIKDTLIKRDNIKSKEIEKQQLAISNQTNDHEIEIAFVTTENAPKKKQKVGGKDAEYYISYRPQDADTEVGYSVHGTEHGANFVQNARQASLEIVADDPDEMKKKKGDLRWDSKKHKFTRDTIGSDNKKRIRTDNGTIVLASFKAERYPHWILIFEDTKSGRRKPRLSCHALVKWNLMMPLKSKKGSIDTTTVTSPH